MRVIITGSTGMVGKGALLEAIRSPDVTAVLVINRSPVDIRHEKMKEILHNDFFDLTPILLQLGGYDGCLFCLGVSSVGMDEKAYTKMTFDLTISFARAVLSQNPGMTFCYISGAGTDSSEAGRLMWARVKGRTENALLGMGFKAAYMFRPGFIQPMDGIKAKSNMVNVMYTLFSPFYGMMKRMKGMVTNTQVLGLALLRVAQHGYEKSILESRDINAIGK